MSVLFLKTFFKNVGLNLIFQLGGSCLPQVRANFHSQFFENVIVEISNFSRYYRNQRIFANFWCIKLDFFGNFGITINLQTRSRSSKMSKLGLGYLRTTLKSQKIFETRWRKSALLPLHPIFTEKRIIVHFSVNFAFTEKCTITLPRKSKLLRGSK